MQKNIFIFVILSFLMLLKISAQKIEAVKNLVFREKSNDAAFKAVEEASKKY